MTTLYQYIIKAGNGKTVLTGKGSRIPISAVMDDAEARPIVAASVLRDLAKWAIEQAEIIEELEGNAAPKRKPFRPYKAALVEA